MNTTNDKKARALGINHVVLEVGDLDQALEFYGAIFEFKLRGKSDHNAFIDMGDQFIQLSLGKTQGPDDKRHFGFVVDDRGPVRGHRRRNRNDACRPAPGSCQGSTERTGRPYR